MGHTFELNREDTPSYTIRFEDGNEHSVDPFEVVASLQESGVVDDRGEAAVGQKQLVERFREAIGLPQLSFSNALLVLQDFQQYVESAEKKLLDSPSSPRSTDGTQPTEPTPKPASASTGTSEGSARKSV